MKTINIILSTTLTFLLVATACCKKPITPIVEVSTNTVTCTINGTPLTSTGGKPSDNPWLGCQTGIYTLKIITSRQNGSYKLIKE
jgi:hypothetical protein